MTIVAACRAMDGTLIFGADRQLTADDGTLDGPKLREHPLLLKGTAVIGMAAENASHGLAYVTKLRIALNKFDPNRDQAEMLLERMKAGPWPIDEQLFREVELLCGIAFRSLGPPKLYRMSETGIDEILGTSWSIGSGSKEAHSVLEQMEGHLLSLCQAQKAVCAGVWAAKQNDNQCGGGSDIWCLTSDAKLEKIPKEQIEAWESYFKGSFHSALSDWIRGAPRT